MPFQYTNHDNVSPALSTVLAQYNQTCNYATQRLRARSCPLRLRQLLFTALLRQFTSIYSMDAEIWVQNNTRQFIQEIGLINELREFVPTDGNDENSRRLHEALEHFDNIQPVEPPPQQPPNVDDYVHRDEPTMLSPGFGGTVVKNMLLFGGVGLTVTGVAKIATSVGTAFVAQAAAAEATKQAAAQAAAGELAKTAAKEAAKQAAVQVAGAQTAAQLAAGELAKVAAEEAGKKAAAQIASAKAAELAASQALRAALAGAAGEGFKGGAYFLAGAFTVSAAPRVDNFQFSYRFRPRNE
jgi:hypothetical protein